MFLLVLFSNGVYQNWTPEGLILMNLAKPLKGGNFNYESSRDISKCMCSSQTI